jgi:catechol 2,3-dioxygenase-like lactoylglutathione lyase family enzyme
MKRKTWIAIVAIAFGTSVAVGDDVKRPRLTGVAHMAIYAHDVDKSLAFYKDFLGFGEPFRLTKSSGGLHLTLIKISDRQYIELFPENVPGTDRLNHIALETDDAEAMRAYLASRGVKVPDKVGIGRIGNANFNITDPDGHTVEIVQYKPEGWTMREQGKYLGDARISERAMHVGITVAALDPALEFYRDILGLQEIWRGSSSGQQLNWVNMKVPDGDDYVEFMLYKNTPSLARLGVMHHLCLEVPDISKAKTELVARASRAGYTQALEVKTGVNGKRQLNLFDPDGTRIELMEPKTADGKPVPSSTAPPPK